MIKYLVISAISFLNHCGCSKDVESAWFVLKTENVSWVHETLHGELWLHGVCNSGNWKFLCVKITTKWYSHQCLQNHVNQAPWWLWHMQSHDSRALQSLHRFSNFKNPNSVELWLSGVTESTSGSNSLAKFEQVLICPKAPLMGSEEEAVWQKEKRKI